MERLNFYGPRVLVFCIGSVSIVSILAFLSFSSVNPPIHEGAGPLPPSGCAVVKKTWTEQSGGGGDFLSTSPINTEYKIAFLFPNGEEKTITVNEDTFGGANISDKMTVEWVKTSYSAPFASLTRISGEVWSPILHRGCPN